MQTQPEIEQALDHAYRRLLALIESLDDARLRVPYHPGINPPVWEGGHTAFFLETFLLRPWLARPPIMPGLDPVWDSFDIDHEDRWRPDVVPGKAATLDYMRAVHESVLECLATRPLTPQDLYLCKYGIFHQHMHIESMIWACQTLGYAPPPFTPPPFAQPTARPETAGAAPGDVTIPAGRYRIGMPADSPDFAAAHFAFDCEKPGFLVDLPEFAISRTLVSNGAFLEFVEAEGYRNGTWWSWGGRKWLSARAAADGDVTRQAPAAPPDAPIYWKREEGAWRQRHFDRWLPLDPAAPVLHVSYWEAEAYCNWAGRRLPTEFEWEAAALGRGPDSPAQLYPWGAGMDAGRADLDAAALHRPAVNDLAAGDSRFGCRQMLGTAWEWTASPFLPYDGFRVDMYPYMSTLQFGTHRTTKGGSWATASSLIRGSYRQAYLPERRDVFVGFRTCAR